ncbi:MAG: hypothetical protein ACUVQ9_09850 [Thermodesulfobacteriota bacterium]
MNLKKIFISFLFILLIIPAHSFSEDINELAYKNRFLLKAGTVLNPDGVGDCLIFPYFDIRKVEEVNQSTEIIIENSSAYGIVARLRLRDGFWGRELFTTDIWIPSEGQWSARIVVDETGQNGKVYSNDPVVVNHNYKYFYTSSTLVEGSPFITKNMKKDRQDFLFYGYIELIGSEKTSPLNSDGRVERLSSSERDCPNTLTGRATIMRSNGSSSGYEALAIGNFSRGQGSLFRSTKSSHPDLSDCEDTLDQLEFQLSKWEIYASFINNPSTGEKTSLIITFPTRQFHYKKNGQRIYKLNNPFTSSKETNGGENFDISLMFEDGNIYANSNLNLPFSVNIIGCYKDYTGEARGIDNISLNTLFLDSGRIKLTSKAMAQRVWIKDYEYLQERFERYWGYPSLGIVLYEYINPPDLRLNLTPIEYSVNWISSGRESISMPQKPSGPSFGKINESYTFITGSSVSSSGHPVEYQFDWGDGTLSPWGGPSQEKTWTVGGVFIIRARARCSLHPDIISRWSDETFIVIETVSSPSFLSGPTTGIPGVSYTYTTGGSYSSLGHPVQYFFDWGDGTDSNWLPLGETSATKFWLNGGEYVVTAKARCANDPMAVSDPTPGLKVKIELISPPSKPVGETKGLPWVTYTYMTGGAVSNIGHTVEYQFDWGDGSYSEWLSGTKASKAWTKGGNYSVRARARCTIHPSVVSEWSQPLEVKIEAITTPLVSGPQKGNINTSYKYTVSKATSNIGDPIQYLIDWGDGTETGWLPVGVTEIMHSWSKAGSYIVRAKARCSIHTNIQSEWSEGLEVTITNQ